MGSEVRKTPKLWTGEPPDALVEAEPPPDVPAALVDVLPTLSRAG
jgi:hypothetical protein